MAKALELSDTILASGQNEGIERAILPLPQLSYVQNARMRKLGRWGKRWGHASLSLTNLGTGTGNVRAVGGSNASCFAIVDDRCCGYNQTAAAFVLPSAVAPVTGAVYPRIPGAVSGWLPDTSFFPVPARSLQNQTTTPCSSCYALGYLWTAAQSTDPAVATDKAIRVVATDPNDQTVVFSQDFVAAAGTFGGIFYPKLITCGSTVVLTYTDAFGAGTFRVSARNLTSLAGGFGAAVVLLSGITGYDASAYSATQFIAVFTQTGGGGSAATLVLDATTLGGVGGVGITDSSASPITSCSIVGSVAAGIFVGYGVAATTTAKVKVFTAGFGAVTGTATLGAFEATKPLLALLQGGGVRCVFGININGTAGAPYGFFRLRDVSAAAVAGANTCIQYETYPISIPFSIGPSVYMWTKTETGGPGYATLIRLPPPGGYSASADISCPLELSTQDYLVSTGQGTAQTDTAGIPTVAQIGTTASYAVPVPTLYTAPGQSVTTGHDFRILQAKHYTDVMQRRSVQTLYADSGSFVPLGSLTRVDDRGAAEEGFVHQPTVDTPTPSAGGGLTASSTYFYTAVFKSRNSQGRFEISAPATPVKVVMGVGQGTNNVQINALGLTARASVQIEVYRTLSNGPTYYLLAVIDSVLPSVGIVDTKADSVIAGNATLYVQSGQTLQNSFPPPSRFGCVGGQRLFLGGLIRPDIVQASKLIFGDQSPSFADNDAFRIVLPSACTGLAFMDTVTMFTTEGIYIATGDGPTDDGLGDFGGLTRLPFSLGCIEPRSVITVDDGTYFQSARGLYLLPRGFGTPVPAGDMVMDTLAAFPIITGVATLTKTTEQTILWTCVNTGGTAGVRIVYDLVHKAWSVDQVFDVGLGASAPMSGIGQWIGGETVTFGPNVLTSTSALQVSNSGFVEAQPNSGPINMILRTGDMRPFGSSARGIVQRYAVMGELRSACTVNTLMTTDQTVTPSSPSRVFTGVAPDTVVGANAYIQVDMGAAQRRDVTAMKLELSESSTTEGFAFISMGLETGPNEGMRLTQPADREV